MSPNHFSTNGTYIDPTTDPGFKILFGREAHKEVLIDFLNALIIRNGDDPIVDIYYLDKEKVKEREEERTLLYDIHCETKCGKRFIVEMQNGKQAFFVNRSLYYTSRAVTEQGKTDRWDFSFMPVYGVFLMNFSLPELGESAIVDCLIWNKSTGKQLTRSMCWTYIQLPNFTKQTPEECETDIDKWLYNIKYMNTMTTMPFTVAKAFQRLEKVSRVENLSAPERRQYERDLKFFRDYENRMNYAETQGRAQGIAEGRAQGIAEGRTQGIAEGRTQGIAEGRTQGIAEGRAEIVITLRNNGMSESDIAKFTGMTISEIQKICSNI